MAKRDPLTKAVKILENQLEAVHGERVAVAIVVWNGAGRWQLASSDMPLSVVKTMLRCVGNAPDPGTAKVVQV